MRPPRGFTLIEVLAVVTIIALLAALLIPSLGSARTAARRAATKARFNQWAAGLEAFRSEYGYYPTLAPGGHVNDGAAGDLGGDHPFHDLLAGIHRDGSALPAGAPADSAGAQNPKQIRFVDFAEADFNAGGLLQDAFGNSDIAVLLDRDLDGSIRVGTDVAALPTVHAPDGTAISPGITDFPAAGLHASVVFYVAAPDATQANRAFIFSWK